MTIIKKHTFLKPQQQRKNENITRKTYKDGMLVISIPKIKVRAGVMNGTTKKALKKTSKMTYLFF